MQKFRKKFLKDPQASIRKLNRIRWMILWGLFFLLFFLDRLYPGKYRTAFGLIVLVIFYRGGSALMRKNTGQGNRIWEEGQDICFRCGADMKDAFYSIDYCDYCYIELKEEERFREEEEARR